MNRFSLIAGFFLSLSAPLFGAELHLRINTGGEDVVDEQGNVWLSDLGFAHEGRPYIFPGPKSVDGVDDPAPAEVYRTVRHQDHSFGFPSVPNGHYIVRIHLVDGKPSRNRRMDFHAEGKLRLNDINPYEAADERVNHVVVREFPVTVSAGKGLRIACLKNNGNDVFEAAIEILSSEPLPQPDYTPLQPGNPAGGDGTAGHLRAELLESTGGVNARLVWVQVDDPEDFRVKDGLSARLMAVGAAGDEAGSVREILSGRGPIQKPLLTSGGSQVVFSNEAANEAWVVNWDGGGLRRLGEGYASDVWKDPATGIEWVYLRKPSGRHHADVVRRQLDYPEIEETVWTGVKADAHTPWLQLSADGARAAEAFPWPRCGVAMMDRPSFEWDLIGNGCWPGMAPDNSYRFFYFEGNHTCLSLFEPGDPNSRTVPVNTMPSLEGSKVYHPRWASHPRFLTVTGPQKSRETELYLGRFSEDYSHIEAWVRVTHNGRPDFFGDAWIDQGGRFDNGKDSLYTSKPAVPSPQPSIAAIPAEPEGGLVFLWNDNRSKNEVTYSGQAAPASFEGQLRGRASFDRFFGLSLRDGWVEFAGQTEQMSRRLQASGEITLAATLTPGRLGQSGPARIVTYSAGSQIRNFTLGQEGDRLVIRLRTSHTDLNAAGRQMTFGRLEANRPATVVLRYRDGELIAQVNGQEVLRTSALTGDFSNWTRQHLLFGDEWGGDRNWQGRLDHVRIYDRFLPDEEVAILESAAARRLAERAENPAPRLVLDARLVEATPLPQASDLGSYRRGLVENVYEVVAVHEYRGGTAADETEKFAPGDRLVVSEWAVMDGKKLSASLLPAPEETVHLELEPESAHPQLKSEWRKSELLDFTSPRFYRVGP